MTRTPFRRSLGVGLLFEAHGALSVYAALYRAPATPILRFDN